MWKSGIYNVSTLQKTTGFPRRTLFRWAKQLKETNNLKQRHRQDRPKLLTPNKRRYLGHIAKSRKLASSAELTETLKKTYSGFNIASRTLRENLQKLGYKVCIPRPVPLLTEKAIACRVAWARAHQSKQWNYWSKTIFSDELIFQMFTNTTQVRYKIGEPKPRRATVKHPFKVHVWGAFFAKRTVGFHIFTENMNAELYREILNQNLFDQAYQLLGNRWIFQRITIRSTVPDVLLNFLRIVVRRFLIGRRTLQISIRSKTFGP